MAQSRTPQAAPEPNEGNIFMKAGMLFALGAGLLLAAAIVLAISLGGWGGLAALLGGLSGSLLAAMAAIFTITPTTALTESRFNLLKLAGLLAIPGGVALGLAVGGLLGVGLVVLALAVSALLIGFGIIAGVPDAATPPKR